MTSAAEFIRIALALTASKLVSNKFRTRLCRLIYNYNSKWNSGIDCVINYQPVKEIRTLKIFVNTREFISWNIFFLNHYELETDLILLQFIKKGMHVLEAGAQIGSETVLLGELVGESGRVYAFEPNPSILKRLQINITINSFSDRIIPSAIALGDANQIISFFIDDEREPNQGRSSKYKYDATTVKISVQQQTLDDWVLNNDVPKIDFIKMDVQGAEIDILNGAAKTIADFKPLIFAEASASMQENSKYSMKEMYRTIIKFGYSVHRIDANGTLHQISEASLVSGNWLAIPT